MGNNDSGLLRDEYEDGRLREEQRNIHKELQITLDIMKSALRRAAEETYISEIFVTNLAVREIREEAEKYEYYSSEEEEKHAIDNCQWATKEEWIQDKIKEWMKNR